MEQEGPDLLWKAASSWVVHRKQEMHRNQEKQKTGKRKALTFSGRQRPPVLGGHW